MSPDWMGEFNLLLNLLWGTPIKFQMYNKNDWFLKF